MSEHQETIDALMAENRTFPPPEHIKRDALVVDTHLYDEAAADDEGFWARQAGDLLEWTREWDTICEWELPYAKWFVGGQLNVSANCLDRHVAAGVGDRVAIHWEGEPGDTRTITYAELHAEVQRFANALRGLGVQKGDRVNIYLPMIPEAAVAMLACAAYRRRPQRRLRRVLGPGARGPHQRRRGQGADHRRRRLPARRGVPAQAGRRRGGGGDVDDRACRRRAARQERRRDGRGTGPLVPRPARRRRGRVHGRADGLRGPVVPALHLGHDGQAEGHHAHHGRLPHARDLHPQVRVRPAPRDRRVLVHRRRRVGDRAQLHRLWAAVERRHGGDVRGCAELPGQRPVLGRSSRSTR